MIDIELIVSTVKAFLSRHSALPRDGGWFLLAYLIGALPIGFWIARLAGIDDITRHGSGTMGATNVARTLGVPFFFLVFCIDAGKAVLVMQYAPVVAWPLCIIGLIFGNTCSIFLRGGGGKGVATLVGILAIVNSSFLLLSLSIWLLALVLLRSVGKASACALFSLSIVICFTSIVSPIYLVLLCAAIYSLYCHRTHVVSLFDLLNGK